MRTLVPLLLLAACAREPDLPEIALDESYRIESGGGQLVVGALLPHARPIRVASLLTRRQLAAYLDEERLELPQEEEPDVFEYPHAVDAGHPRYAAVEEELSRELGVTVLVREITAAERRRIPVLLEPRTTLVARCRAALARVRRIDRDPFEVARARREGRRAFVEFARKPDRVTLVGLAGEIRWSGDPASGFELDGVNPYECFLVAESRGLRRAWSVADLVGATDRILFASREAVAGAAFAVRVVYRNTRTGTPVAGERDRVRLTTRDGTTIGETEIVSDATGSADVRLLIPEDTPAGAALLYAGRECLPIRIRHAKRISLATDRTVYRPDDRIFVRLMARRSPSGRALADEPLVLRHEGAERSLTTSAHGIASTELVLRDARPGKHAIEARCGEDRAQLRYTVEAFELPRFEIRFVPSQLRMREGETAPLRLVARYVNGSPLAGAEVRIESKRYVTDERGEVELTATGVEWFVVKDADGRTVKGWTPVLLESGETPPARKQESARIRVDTEDPQVGERLTVTAPPGEGPLYLDLLRDGVLLRTLAAAGDRVEVALDEHLAGPLDLHAYRLAGDERVGDRRRIWVRRDNALQVEAKPDRPEYRPGETARVDVEVRDEDGSPTSAALGFWAVDQALLSVRDAMGDGDEMRFDLRDRSGSGLDTLVRRRRSARLQAVARRTASAIFRARIEAIQARLEEIYLTLPEEKFRTADSVRERLRRDVRRGKLDPGALLDPWGTPLGFAPTRSGGLHWSSAGPDRVWRSTDDLGCMRVLTLPERMQDFIDYVRACTHGRVHLEPGLKDWREWNYAIGIGGGAGGRWRGRAGRRNLRLEGGSKLGVEPVRLRRESSPTLCFVPETIVGADGVARLQVPLADALTTWRMRLVASRNDGATGIGYTSIRVRQPLSIEPWIAPHLTVGDELDLPVAIHNETEGRCAIALRIEASDAIEIRGAGRATVEVDAGRTGAYTFRMRARTPGRARIRIHAEGGGHADAVERLVHIRPDGREVTTTVAGRPDAWNSFDAAGPGTLRAEFYPDPVSEALGGLEGMIREPHGCFEQTSSTLYPMVLVLDYLRRTKQSRPELEAKAHAAIESGYRRLLSYEVNEEPGGFSLWGRAPANPSLTAYGLMEFADMARVHEVDAAVVIRMEKFLRGAQADDGSWEGDFKRTAYIAWALESAGYPNPKAREYLSERRPEVRDPYALALAALAGVTRLGNRDWKPEGETVFWSRGRSGEIETTALAAQALRKQGDLAEAHAAVRRLLDWRGSDGRFGTTQSTVQALRAILSSTGEGPPQPTDVRIVAESGGVIRSLRLEHDVERVEFDTDARFAVRCDRPVPFGLTHTGHAPWGAAEQAGRVGLEVRYPDETLRVGRTARIRAVVRHRGRGVARQAIAEIGVPPGCDVDHRAVRGAQSVERGRTTVVLYLGDLASGETREFEIGFTPRYRLDVKTSPSVAYEYYTPEVRSSVPPASVQAR